MAVFKIIAFVFVGLMCVSVRSVSSQRHEATLDPEGKFIVGWSIDTVKQRITFDVAVETKGYFGLGISDSGDMYGLDAFIGMVLDDGTATIMDAYADGNFRPGEDYSQDLELIYGYESATHTYLRFSRALDTGDEYDDNVITDRDTYLVYAIGVSDNLNYHASRGSYAVNLFRPSLKHLN